MRLNPIARTARSITLGTLLWLPVALAAPVAVAAAESATDTVESLHAALAEVMQSAQALGYEGRRDRLAPVVERSFDFPFIVELIMGAHWASLTVEQRARMVTTFARLTVSTYADRFDGFDGERFVTRAAQELRQGRVAVRTALERPGNDAITLDYVVQKSANGWCIVNVVAGGVSNLALKRSDYDAVMSREGFDTLISKLEKQIADHSKDG